MTIMHDELCCEYRLSSSPQDGRSAMIHAAGKGKVDMVCELEKQGVQVHHADKVT